MLTRLAEYDDLALLNRVDAACDEFESLLRRDARPRIEDFLAAEPESIRDELLKNLLFLEFEYRSRAGDSCDLSDYHRRFPQAVDLIAGIRETSDHVLLSPSPSVAESSHGFPQVLGRFRLKQLLGRGGMGAVFRATDSALGRDVAIKIPHPLNSAVADHERFAREGRNAARLRHPGIVAVLEVGVADSGPFIVSEFIDGPTLAQIRAADKAIDFRSTARFVAEIAEAIESAHQCGVVHRDLKPSNVLLEPRTNENLNSACELAKYRPRIADFGLARQLDSDSLLTNQGDILGTPAYMSPEQARGNANAADARSDIFSLGILLYELICGKLPFQGTSPQLMHQVATLQVPDVRRANPNAPADLSIICQHCVALDPDRRYQRAGGIAADLRRWLAGMPISAKRVPSWERLSLWVLRHKKAVSTAAAVVATVCTLALSVAMLSSRLAGAHKSATAEFLEQLKTTPSEEVPILLRRLSGFPEIDSNLRSLLASEELPGVQRSRVLLALSHYDSSVVPELAKALLTLDAREYLLVSDALAPHSETAIRVLRQELDGESGASASQWLRAVSFIARCSPPAASDLLAPQQFTDRLLGEAGKDPVAWAQVVKPFQDLLVAPLVAQFRNDSSTERRAVACELLVELNRKDMPRLVDLLRDADDRQLRVIVSALERDPARALESLGEHTAAFNESAVHDEPTSKAIANLALATVRLRDHGPVPQVLAARADPRCREYFVHRAEAAGLSPPQIFAHLKDESDGDIQYALLVAIGQYPVLTLTQAMLKGLGRQEI